MLNEKHINKHGFGAEDIQETMSEMRGENVPQAVSVLDAPPEMGDMRPMFQREMPEGYSGEKERELI